MHTLTVKLGQKALHSVRYFKKKETEWVGWGTEEKEEEKGNEVGRREREINQTHINLITPKIILLVVNLGSYYA